MVIFTKYFGPSNVRGARIAAWAPGWDLSRVYISYPHEKSGADCHAEAARALLIKAGKNQKNDCYIYAAIPGGYCFIPRDNGPLINLGV